MHSADHSAAARTNPYDVVYAILRLVGDHGGRFGRTRAACAIGGLPAPALDPQDVIDVTGYDVVRGWSREELVDSIDRLIASGWIERSDATEPKIELSKSGFEFRVMIERELRERAQEDPQLTL
ncbi:MAG: hypothetical protein JWM25_855 [Thermoleophilia bacterium]|nr:hypothetical protein [Thermoleophilia bacterium]MCZ4496272.1 hypothetical protein [Thermoleophilia bacterium]